jgi:hypothetical protein
MTFTSDASFVEPVKAMMLASRQAAVDYMTPLGLTHLMARGHHYGPGPGVSNAGRADQNSTYFHRADAAGIGFDRTATGQQRAYRSTQRRCASGSAGSIACPTTISSGSTTCRGTTACVGPHAVERAHGPLLPRRRGRAGDAADLGIARGKIDAERYEETRGRSRRPGAGGALVARRERVCISRLSSKQPIAPTPAVDPSTRSTTTSRSCRGTFRAPGIKR